MIYSMNEGIIIPTKKGKEFTDEYIKACRSYLEHSIRILHKYISICEKAFNVIYTDKEWTKTDRDKIEAYCDELSEAVKEDKKYTLGLQDEDIKTISKFLNNKYKTLADRIFDKDTKENYKSLVRDCAKDGKYGKQFAEDVLNYGQKVIEDATEKMKKFDEYVYSDRDRTHSAGVFWKLIESIGNDPVDIANVMVHINPKKRIFESVRFLDEGQQTDEYKARKEKEKQDELDSRIIKHYKGNRYDGSNFSNSAKEKVEKEWENRHNKYAKALNNGTWDDFSKAKDNRNNMFGKMQSATDAADRHMRRHPKQYAESVIENLKMI